jgi:ATP synthase protein I
MNPGKEDIHEEKDLARLDVEIALRERRAKKAQRARRSLLAQSMHLGTLGLVFVLPIVGGSYIGNWLDGLQSGYSMRWTLSLMFLGIIVGGTNVYLMIRD